MQDVRDAGERVLVILAGSGFCSSVEECTERSCHLFHLLFLKHTIVPIFLIARCAEEPQLCGAPREQILEKEGGIWSNELNPFADHFKVVLATFALFFNNALNRFLSPPAPVTAFLGNVVPPMQVAGSTSRVAT